MPTFSAGQHQENIQSVATATGAVTDAAVTDPTSSTASSIALLKGMLSINVDNVALIASSAYTTTQTSADQLNYRGRGLVLFIKTGAFGSGASAITVTIQGKDPVSGSVYTILQSASLTASSFTVLRAYPGLTASANVTANDVLPKTWNVTAQASAWGTGGSVVGVACSVIK